MQETEVPHLTCPEGNYCSVKPLGRYLRRLTGSRPDAVGIADPSQRTQILGLCQAMWPRLSADCDSNGDGRITCQEFITAFSSGRGDAQAYYQQLIILRPDQPETARVKVYYGRARAF